VIRSLLVSTALLLLVGGATAEAPRVVASIKPVHSLVAAVMGELGSPGLLVRGNASPHIHTLRPSDAAALEGADLVFWTGAELFLTDAVATLAPGATSIALGETAGIELLPLREGGAFDDDHGDVAAGQGRWDMHFWLDPANAAVMVGRIAEALAVADPENAAIYAANAQQEQRALRTLTASLDAALGPVRDKPFIVFHDAYQYFERRFGLSVTGTLTVLPDSPPGAQRIAELRDRVAHGEAVCVFAEPQFDRAILETIVAGTAARAGTLDPEGAGLPEGPGLYAALLEELAGALLECLSGAAPER
jgi:zinc transport system substrate-binding protein